jgi:hypothetical protein
VELAIGALILAVPASAVAFTVAQADTPSTIPSGLALIVGQSAAPNGIPASVRPHRPTFDAKVTVTGKLAPSDAGETLQLQFAPAAGPNWRPLGATRVDGDGRFRFVMPAKRSGLVRVVPTLANFAPPPPIQPIASAPSRSLRTRWQRVAVSARFDVRVRSIAVLGGQFVHVRGKLAPAIAGRHVRLLGRSGRGWRTLATARTGPRGGFDLRYSPGATDQQSLRVGFAGDRLNRSSWARVGEVTVLHPSVASWYYDAGSTACGFHAQFGVANKSLPCGTKVTFSYGGRTVTATVDDRGPYVSGREWDLSQTTAGALGFGGVGTVLASL